MANGGARPGSGRKPTAVGKYRKEIAAAKDLMGNALVPVTNALLDAATGAYVLMTHDGQGNWERVPSEKVAEIALTTGAFRVYREDPDLRAILAVHERIMGKVVQPVNPALREVIENAIADQDLIATILERHVPAEHFSAIITDIRRVREHRRQADAILGNDATTA